MANATPSRVGQINAAGDTLAMFLKVFSGETMAAFDEVNVMLAKSMVRSIKSGKQAQFPATGKTTAGYHTPGAEIVGQAINGAEKTIDIDGILYSDVFVSEIDEAMNHYEIRGEYSRQAGLALAYKMDKNLLQVGVLAARASATVTGLSGGTALTDADFHTNADSIVTTAFDCATTFDQKDIPQDERYLALPPATYYLAVQSGKAIHGDWNPGMSNGSVAAGRVSSIAGLELVRTNHLPNTVVNTGPTAYQGTFTNVKGLAWHKSAVGTVKLIDLATRADYDPRRLGTLIVSKMAVGHGILRPESAIEIKSA